MADQLTPEQRADHVAEIRNRLRADKYDIDPEDVEFLLGEVGRISGSLQEQRDSNKWIHCSFCGHKTVPAEGAEARTEQMIDHVMVCKEHPLPKLIDYAAGLEGGMRLLVAHMDRWGAEGNGVPRYAAEDLGAARSLVQREQGETATKWDATCFERFKEQRAEVDRLTAELAAEREDHNAAKTGWERAAGELHAADERTEKAEQLARAYQQTLEERTRERDEARAGYHALDRNWEKHHEACMRPIREALGLPDGSVLDLVTRIKELSGLRQQLDALRPGEGWELVRLAKTAWADETHISGVIPKTSAVIRVPRSALVQFPPAPAAAEGSSRCSVCHHLAHPDGRCTHPIGDSEVDYDLNCGCVGASQPKPRGGGETR